ncbi:MAG: hypothetical protein ABIK28_00700 [Planctomycetota bacterium]
MSNNLTRIKLLTVLMLAGILNLAWSDKVTVWIDDAHTKKILVSKVDPDEIADKSQFSIGIGKSLGSLGISLSWSRETGVEYTEKMDELIEQVKDLCEEFNDGDISLESYRRRLRDIFDAEEKARTFKYRMLMSYALMANEKFMEMDTALGGAAQETSALKAHIDESLALFSTTVDELPHRLAESTEYKPSKNTSPLSSQEKEPVLTLIEQTQEEARQSVLSSLEAFKRSVDKDPTPPRSTHEMITVFKDYARTQTIRVPKLDCEGLIDDISKSLSVGTKYSGYFLSFDVGPRVTRVLKRAADYTEASQILIVKYRQLCMEFNAGLECLDGYVDRLRELMEAEHKAQQTRDRLFEFLKDEALSQMDNFFAKSGKDKTMEGQDDMEALRKEMLDHAKKDIEKKTPSVVEAMSQEHRVVLAEAEKMADTEIEEFRNQVNSIRSTRLGGGEDRISVWKDDTRTEEVDVSRLDTDLIAQTTTTRLSLHITWFNFGPEYEWAKKKGLEFDEAAQRLIIMYKQLCMDFNAGLVSLKGFHEARERIDAAIARAAEVRERMQLFMQAMKKNAIDEMDRHFDMDSDDRWGK